MASTPTPGAEQPGSFLYHYRATVTAVHDGDTCTVDIDLGLGTWVHGAHVRLNRINAPELHGVDQARGEAARDYLTGLLLDKAIVLQTIKDTREKFGRYLGEVWLERDGQPALNVNDDLVTTGHARYQKY